jgi:hypothetical protein
VKRPLSVRDVGELLQRSPRTRNAILVGGQSLNLWAVNLGLAAEAAVVSRDIDFFGSRADAIAAGLDWQAEVHTGSLNDHTPNSAVVVVEIENEQHGIDFLNSIAGVDTEELRRWAARVRGQTYDFYVMHPLHVLQSQLENVYGLLRRREEQDGDYYVDRVILAIRVAAAAVAALLDEGRVREALKAAERIATIAPSRPALVAWARDEVNMLDAIPDHPAWPKRFVQRRLLQIASHVRDQRDKHQQGLRR